MPDPPFASLETLLCSEILPDSPALGSHLEVQTTASNFKDDRRPRVASTDFDDTLYSERVLLQKLRDQKITLDAVYWGKVITTRRDLWMRAYQMYLDNDLSLETLQMAISFLDRFVEHFRQDYDGDIEESAPLDCLFEAALWCSNMVLDDGAGQCESSLGRKEPDNVQLSIKLMLDVTQWNVIDCTAASFVPHFMEEARVRHYDGLRQQILAVTTLFMIDQNVASNVPPSSMAALAVVFQSWLVMDNAFTHQTPQDFAAAGMVHPSDFLKRSVTALLSSAKMTLGYFLQMSDFVLSSLFATEWHDGLDAIVAWKFAHLMKELFGTLPRLEQVCLPLLVGDGDCDFEMSVDQPCGISVPGFPWPAGEVTI